jgi:hypothetical protein
MEKNGKKWLKIRGVVLSLSLLSGVFSSFFYIFIILLKKINGSSRETVPDKREREKREPIR